jgi:hypothetical protein
MSWKDSWATDRDYANMGIKPSTFLEGKEKCLKLIEDFEKKWTEEISSHFHQEHVKSIPFQLEKSKWLLASANTEADCKVVETRMVKLTTWVDHHLLDINHEAENQK